MSDESPWVVAPDEARIDITIGKDATLSPAVRDALNRLVQVIEQEDEVAGYMSCSGYAPKCSPVFTCTRFSSA